MSECIRKMDELGRILIPMDVQSAIGAKAKDDFRITQVGTHTIELTLVKEDECVRCHTTENIIEAPFGCICETCLFDFVSCVFQDRVDNIFDRLQDELFHPKDKTR